MNTTHPLARAAVALVVGRRGSGKSELLRRAATLRPRVVVLDVLHGEPMALPGGPPGMIVSDSEEFRDALRRFARFPKWRIVVRPDDPEDSGWLAADLLPPEPGALGVAAAVGGVSVFCDEVDLWAPNHGGIHPAVRAAVQRGRHYGVKIVGATRRPAECHRDLSSQADALATFRQHEPRDVAWLAQACGAEFAEMAAGLDRDAFQYAIWTADNGRSWKFSGRDRLLTSFGG